MMMDIKRAGLLGSRIFAWHIHSMFILAVFIPSTILISKGERKSIPLKKSSPVFPKYIVKQLQGD